MGAEAAVRKERDGAWRQRRGQVRAVAGRRSDDTHFGTDRPSVQTLGAYHYSIKIWSNFRCQNLVNKKFKTLANKSLNVGITTRS